MDSGQGILPSMVPSDDEDSFVVLGSGSLTDEMSLIHTDEENLPPINSARVQEVQSLIKMELSKIADVEASSDPAAAVESVAGVTTQIALTPDSSYEEIQKHVEDLIRENEKLKNVIAQNNLSMRSQYERITAWKDEVNTVMKTYKEKFAEAKVILDKYKEENAKMGGDIEVYRNIKILQAEEIVGLKEKIKQYENDQLVNATVEQNVAEFDLHAARERIQDLETELAEANLKKIDLSAENEKLMEKLVGTPKYEEDLENLQKKNTQLEFELNATRNQQKNLCDDIVILKNENQELQQEIKRLIISKDELLSSNASVYSLQEEIHQKEIEIAQLKEAFARTKTELESAYGKLANLQKVYNPNMENECQQLRLQLSNSQMTVTALNEDVEHKNKEIGKLKQLVKSSTSKDEIFAIQQQLEVFKTDFEAEKQSKNAIKREKDQLIEDLRNVQKRNSQLQNEIEILRAKQTPKAEGYMCPKCSFGFNTYQSLENHVHRCLDLEALP